MNIKKIRLVAVVAATACMTALRLAANEPDYQDRSLSEWLRDFDTPNPNPQQASIVADAIRHIGSAAVPYLVACLSEASNKLYEVEIKRWQANRTTNNLEAPRPPCPRQEALAALDALGAEGAAALPALKTLLDDDPPDPQVLYVAARMGPAGAMILNCCRNSTNKLLRLETRVCFDMIRSHSEVLYPPIPVGPDAPSFHRRICEFNVKVLQAAFENYKAEHPDEIPPDQKIDSSPPPVLPK